MKKFLLFAGLVFLLAFMPVLALADDAANPLAVLSFLQPMIAALAGKYGVVVQILTVIGVMRVIFKPVFAIAHTVTLAIPGDKDDLVLKKVEDSAITKWIGFILDFFGSIKLPTSYTQK